MVNINLPIAQTGAKAVFVDSEPETLQMKVSDIKKAIIKKRQEPYAWFMF